MKQSTSKLRLILILSTACAFAFGSSQAYGQDQATTSGEVRQSGVWVQPITAVSENPPVLRSNVKTPQLVRISKPLPRYILPLKTDMEVRVLDSEDFTRNADYVADDVINRIDLVEDSPLFIGAKGASEFDTIEAIRQRAAYPDTINIEPLFTIAGAGVETSF